ncbi:MAG: hypothetical protein AB2L14_19470 [Candidatus Xenobiia bacterium LiM19]
MNSSSFIFLDKNTAATIDQTADTPRDASAEYVPYEYTPSPGAVQDAEVKVPEDVSSFFSRLTSKNDSTLATAPSDSPVMHETMADIKNIAYRIGWLDGHEELRKKFIDSYKLRYRSKEEEYESKIMKLSHLLNCRDVRISEYMEENKALMAELEHYRQKIGSLEGTLNVINIKQKSAGRQLEEKIQSKKKLEKQLAQIVKNFTRAVSSKNSQLARLNAEKTRIEAELEKITAENESIENAFLAMHEDQRKTAAFLEDSMIREVQLLLELDGVKEELAELKKASQKQWWRFWARS